MVLAWGGSHRGTRLHLREETLVAVHRGLKEDRGDFLVWLKRTWLRFLGNLDQAVGH